MFISKQEMAAITEYRDARFPGVASWFLETQSDDSLVARYDSRIFSNVGSRAAFVVVGENTRAAYVQHIDGFDKIHGGLDGFMQAKQLVDPTGHRELKTALELSH